MRRTFATLAALALAACGEPTEGENADDFAARVDAGGTAAAAPKGAQPDGPRDRSLPRVAADGRTALRPAASYTQPNADGSADSLAIRQDGTYTLIEDGRTTNGAWEWLADGRRLRLEGLVQQPIVLVADGALYRMQNEDVPFDDVTPDRAYRLAAAGQ